MTFKDVISVAKEALKKKFINNEQTKETAIRFFEMAEKVDREAALEIAGGIMISSPSCEAFERIKRLNETDDDEWEKRKEKALEKLEENREDRLMRDDIKESTGILALLFKEGVSNERICEFLRKECHGFSQASFALSHIEVILKHIGERKTDDEFWYCAVHFNILVAVINEIKRESKTALIRMAEEVDPSFALKLAESMSESLSILLRKKFALIDSEENFSSFSELLNESKEMFTKASRNTEWNSLFKELFSNVKNDWLSEKLMYWKRTSDINID